VEGQVGREAREGRQVGGEQEGRGKGRWEISPPAPRSFLKVTYGLDLLPVVETIVTVE